MKKKIGLALIALTFVALPVGAQTLDKDDVIIGLLQQTIQMMSGISTELATARQENADLRKTVSTMEARLNALESQGAPLGAIQTVSQSSTQADLDKVAELRATMPSNLTVICPWSDPDSERRHWDRIYDLMCTQAGFK